MLNSPQDIQSNDFVPESVPGKKDGKGWRMKKDGAFEIYHRSPGDSVQINYKKEPGKEAEVNYCGISLRQMKEEEDQAATRATDFREFMLGKPYSVSTAMIAEGTIHNDRDKAADALLNQAADVDPVVVKLEALITQQLQMRDTLLSISKTSGLRALGCLAGQHLTTAEALMRELLRQADTREVDDGK